MSWNSPLHLSNRNSNNLQQNLCQNTRYETKQPIVKPHRLIRTEKSKRNRRTRISGRRWIYRRRHSGTKERYVGWISEQSEKIVWLRWWLLNRRRHKTGSDDEHVICYGNSDGLTDIWCSHHSERYLMYDYSLVRTFNLTVGNQLTLGTAIYTKMLEQLQHTMPRTSGNWRHTLNKQHNLP